MLRIKNSIDYPVYKLMTFLIYFDFNLIIVLIICAKHTVIRVFKN